MDAPLLRDRKPTLTADALYQGAIALVTLLAMWWLSVRVASSGGSTAVVMLELVAAGSLAIANGGNDIANAVGTSVGAGALTVEQALGFGSLFEFAGAMLLGSLVSKTISKGVIEPREFADEPEIFAALMFSTVVGAALTTLLATVYGYPISATHGIVGGLVAVGWMARGWGCVGWGSLAFTCVMWILSPIAGMLASYILQLLCYRITQLDLESGMNSLIIPMLWTATLTVTCLFLFLTGPEAVRITPTSTAVVASTAAGIALTLLRYSILYINSLIYPKPATQAESEPLNASGWREDGGSSMAVVPGEGGGMEPPRGNGVHVWGKNEKPFVGLLVLSALTVAFAHGANDVGNAVGPLAVMMEIFTASVVKDEPDVPMWCLVIGALGFVVGIVTLGKNTIETVGNRIIELTPSLSYSTQMGAALAVLLSSVLGMPVSTSHCLVGSVIGVGLAQSSIAMCTHEEAPKINFGIINKIILGWIVTIPLAMVVGFINDHPHLSP
uniref:Phosphate transporter n=1 Tax=Lotharella oceanica TaxID=641309 RepID=A0A7S2TEQ5_9EUKA|mmetsp:Transcript_10698/g.20516  ORF Transcript_10698/g.20516 Transcript_10698/m.20516 type:complete len:500 (+) Transcript_10698:126-1625(+)